MSDRSPAVQPLQIHLENRQIVFFEEGLERPRLHARLSRRGCNITERARLSATVQPLPSPVHPERRQEGPAEEMPTAGG